MAVYGLDQHVGEEGTTNFLYDSGVKYASGLRFEQLYKLNLNDPQLGVKPRHIKVTIKYSSSHKWAVDAIRLIYANREHVIPKYYIPIERRIKRTKVTLKYTSSEAWAVDSLRLKQRITQMGPTV